MYEQPNNGSRNRYSQQYFICNTGPKQEKDQQESQKHIVMKPTVPAQVQSAGQTMQSNFQKAENSRLNYFVPAV
jgi:hypothetical protein